MKSLILRTLLPALVALMIVFSVFVLFRGHNEPGGGFIGALVLASAFALFMLAVGPAEMRRALGVPPIALSGLGVLIAAWSGAPAFFADAPFLTGLWRFPDWGLGFKIPLGTPVLFDIGVYLAVVGGVFAIALAIEEDRP